MLAIFECYLRYMLLDARDVININSHLVRLQHSAASLPRGGPCFNEQLRAGDRGGMRYANHAVCVLFCTFLCVFALGWGQMLTFMWTSHILDATLIMGSGPSTCPRMHKNLALRSSCINLQNLEKWLAAVATLTFVYMCCMSACNCAVNSWPDNGKTQRPVILYFKEGRRNWKPIEIHDNTQPCVSRSPI